MNVRKMMKRGVLLGLMVVLGVFYALSAEAKVLGSGSQSYRIGILNALGVADSSYDSSEACTRAEFARLLVLSSSYKDTSETVLTSAAASDVPASYEGSQYIKTALINGWMRTKLGGTFQPDTALTLNDAARATITILGYTDEDFSSNVTQERLSLFNSLELNEGVTATQGTDIVSKLDAINIIYNLLRTCSKDSSAIYGTAVDLTLDDDGELNATDVIENKMVGPVLLTSAVGLSDVVPFDIYDATYFYNGTNTGYGRNYIESHVNANGWIIIYYNPGSKTIWAYGGESESDTGYYCVSGKVTGIIYENDNIAAPSSVYINSTEYTLNSSDVKFMFSMNGSIGVDDYVVLVCKKNTTETTDDTTTDYYAVAAVKWDLDTNKGSNVIYANNVEKYTSN